MSNESLPTRFIHFLPNSMAMTSDATVTQLSSVDFLNSKSSGNCDFQVNPLETSQSNPRTAPITVLSTAEIEPSQEPEHDANKNEKKSDESLRAQLLSNFEDARAQLVKLSAQTKEMSNNFDEERQQLLETIDELGDQVEFMKRETQVQKDSFRESLEEIENKSEGLSTQLTNTLIENACLREENGLLREEQVELTDRVKCLERKLNRLELDQPRVKKILKSLERREEGLKLQIKRLAQLEASMCQVETNTPYPYRAPSTQSLTDYNDDDYKRVIEKAQTILRKEKIEYVSPIPSACKETKVYKAKRQVPASTSNASTSTQSGPDPREEEEEVLRSLFFPF